MVWGEMRDQEDNLCRLVEVSEAGMVREASGRGVGFEPGLDEPERIVSRAKV